jgi:hypothetical protein
MVLNAENYSRGFLIDEELMAGVTQDPENLSHYVAFILRHTTGEYLGYQPYLDLELAIQAINQIQRSWTFERLGGCGGCADGKCGKGACGSASGGACKVGGTCSV